MGGTSTIRAWASERSASGFSVRASTVPAEHGARQHFCRLLRCAALQGHCPEVVQSCIVHSQVSSVRFTLQCAMGTKICKGSIL